MKKKSLLRTLAATAMTAALGLSLMGAPAQAAAPKVDVTKYTVSDITYSKDMKYVCPRHTVKASIKRQKGWTNYSIQAPVTRNGKLNSTLYYSARSASTPTTFQACPLYQPTGKYVIGKAKISAYTSDYRYAWTNKTDKTTKTFYVRNKGYSSLAAKRSGKNVTFSAAAKYYNGTKYKNLAYNPKSAKIQVKRSGKWATLKTVSFKGGKATVKATMKSTSPAQFRLTFPKTSTVTGSTTKVLKK